MGQAMAFALATPKKRNSFPRGKGLKEWGVAGVLTSEKVKSYKREFYASLRERLH
jgi:hypothetical protein